MDLETENRIAVILMREAAELRRQADKDGLSAYLRDPKARCRPNSRFLTATVLGVQQANKAVEINEMWRVRQKEKELEERLKKRTRSEGQIDRPHSITKQHIEEKTRRDSCSTSRKTHRDLSPKDDDGLKDEELEEFLRARAKRGRGAIGSRMDEPGPYMPSLTEPEADLSMTTSEASFRKRWESRILCPEKPSHFSSDEIVFKDVKSTKSDDPSSKRSSKHSKKHRQKEKSNDKKKKKDKKRKKHRV